MNIRTSSPVNHQRQNQVAKQQTKTEVSQFEDDIYLADDDSSESGFPGSTALLIGGLAILGAAAGAAGGNYSGVLAGVGGALAGATGGATLAQVLPGERVKSGMALGALTGAIVGASFGSPAAAVALGLAGATLPFGALVGVLQGFSSGR